MTVEEMKKRKIELGYSYEQISKRSGVPLGTVQKIFGGATRAPRHETLQALERAFKDEAPDLPDPDCDVPGTSGFYGGFAEGISDYLIREEAAEYICAGAPAPAGGSHPKRQGEYTIEDYYALPDERRVELINGVFYDMAAPSVAHQAISTYISYHFFDYILKNNGKCRVFYAPLDVQLNKDNKTMVQPDILVICSRDKDRKKVIWGAPDLVIEILSDSTRGKDLVLKLNKYCEAGVREYWTVDPLNREVIVFTFNEEIESVRYDASSAVPVGIWENQCEIDLAELFAYAGLTDEPPTDRS